MVDHIVVDTTLDEKLPIGMNITFPALRCDEVSVDTVDSAGENQINIHSNDGSGLQKIGIDALGNEASDPVASPGECFSCFGAQEAKGSGTCCNTCKELKDAYSDAGLSYYDVIKEADQCKHVTGCVV